MTNALVRPDSRGRVALGGVIDKNRTYRVTIDSAGSISLTTVAAVLTDEQMADMQADPQGFADLMRRAAENAPGGIPADEFLA